MQKSSAPAHPSTRISRGIALYRTCGDEITRTEGGTFRVPSCKGDGSFYVVYLVPGFTVCSCPDAPRARKSGEHCKHIHAAGIYAAKRRASRRRRAS